MHFTFLHYNTVTQAAKAPEVGTGNSLMDIAKRFKPKTILLWRKVAEHPEAQRILGLFPSAEVHVIEHQRKQPSPNMLPAQAMLHGKRTLMIGETSSFVGHFDGQPHRFPLCYKVQNKTCSNVHCQPYYKLVPVLMVVPFTVYIAIWHLFTVSTPHLLKLTSIMTLCSSKYERL